MPWNVEQHRWITDLAPSCTGCGQIVSPVDGRGRCSDCALYDTEERRVDEEEAARGEQDHLRIEAMAEEG